jgi:hypothetical protein
MPTNSMRRSNATPNLGKLDALAEAALAEHRASGSLEL